MSASITQPAARSGRPGRIAAAALAGIVAVTSLGVVASQLAKQSPASPIVNHENQAKPLHQRGTRMHPQPATSGTKVYPGQIPSVIDTGRHVYPGQIPSVIDTGRHIYPGQIPSVIDTGTNVVTQAYRTPSDEKTFPGRPGSR